MLAFAVASTAIVAACALAIDLTGALALHARQAQQLELAKDACMASLNALKFADDPAAAAESVVEDALARDGLTGTATVSYRELPESQTGAARRVAGVYLRLDGTYRTVFGGLVGHQDIEVSSEAAWSTTPYSTSEVWRPASARSATWELGFAAGAVTSRAESALGATPAALADALASALAKSPV